MKRGLGRNWHQDPRWWHPQGQARGTLLGALTQGRIRRQWAMPEEQQPLHNPCPEATAPDLRAPGTMAGPEPARGQVR